MLHVIAEMDRGGAERMVLCLGSAGVSAGHEVAVASAPGVWVGSLHAMGVTHYTVPAHRRSFRGVCSAANILAQWFREFKPDVIHAHNPGCAVTARIALGIRASTTPRLTTVHGLASNDVRQGALALRMTSSLVVACTDSVRDELVARSLSPHRVVTIQNGSRLPTPSKDAITTIRRQYLQGGDGRLVVGVGRLVEQKRWDVLIDAASGFPRTTEVVIVGDGPLRSELDRRIDDAGVHAHLVPANDDVADYIGAADCFVSCSRWEGLPMTLLEASALGAPIVASSVDGVHDLFSRRGARLVEFGDVDGLATAVREVLCDDAYRSQLSQDAEAVAGEWSPERMAAQYIDAYRRLYYG